MGARFAELVADNKPRVRERCANEGPPLQRIGAVSSG